MRVDWSIKEVALIVSDYFDMLLKEMSGKEYVKTEHRRKVSKLLERSEGSIEFKHQNISAILIELGLPYIRGYKPRSNYQQLLKVEVEKYLKYNPNIEEQFRQLALSDVNEPNLKEENLYDLEVEVPDLGFIVNDEVYSYGGQKFINYYEKELNNRRLGLHGEEFIVNYEKMLLRDLGRHELSKKIEHISNTEGDGVGFDILSFHQDGREKYIEVKTTKLGKESPFYFTRNELSFSKSQKENYQLYRLFNFDLNPKFFRLKGSLDESCNSISTEFMGFPK